MYPWKIIAEIERDKKKASWPTVQKLDKCNIYFKRRDIPGSTMYQFRTKVVFIQLSLLSLYTKKIQETSDKIVHACANIWDRMALYNLIWIAKSWLKASKIVLASWAECRTNHKLLYFKEFNKSFFFIKQFNRSLD